MAKTREGGLYYINGIAVDANGNAVKGAPKQEPDTIPDPAELRKSTEQRTMEMLAQAIVNAQQVAKK